jgi:hypothetical protein
MSTILVRMIRPGVVIDDDGDVIELPEARRSRTLERERRDAEREARHAERIRRRARQALASLSKRFVRELQDTDVLREFLRLLPDADGKDKRPGR